jgi:uncharacterized coiled-coil protein SlyX
MFNPNFDPMEILEQLQLHAMSQENDISELNGHYKTQAQLMEMMANQIKHLTNAVVGLQNQNKLLLHRMERLEQFRGLRDD